MRLPSSAKRGNAPESSRLGRGLLGEVTLDTDGARSLWPPPLAVNDAVLVPPTVCPQKAMTAALDAAALVPLFAPAVGVTYRKEAEHDQDT